MIESVLAQIRFGASILFGKPFHLRSLDRIIDALCETYHEFGMVGSEGIELLRPPALDEETRKEVHLRRFRTQALRAASETTYYADLFKRISLDPKRLRYEDIQHIPLTKKKMLMANAGAFVRNKAKPCFRATTTGTTGWPTSICFSDYEMRTYITLGAISNLFDRQIEPDDIVQISTSSRAVLGSTCFAGSCTRIGALVFMSGLVEPDFALKLLSEKHHIPGKKSKVSILMTYPSYLGELTDVGLRLGYRPSNFGLHRIILGGEIVTEGLKVRCQQLFGPVQFSEGFGMTEIWPFGGHLCSEGHLHFEISQGLLEVVNLEKDIPVLPGEAGTMVVTPFPPYRETTLLLRYDTQDVVRVVTGPSNCKMQGIPSTSNLLGKLNLSVRHENGWTFPRDVMEALEAVDEVPLPAKFSFWAVPKGVAVEVIVRENTLNVRNKIEISLAERNVPLRELFLLDDRSQLRQPYPLRGDLKETLFSK